ncbi:MAG: pseudaminic acid cytidylyltransferase [Planctomycetota bacterium]|jgi:pseudaminic acid cytidylyltransferase|nr:pseudaminic acid cytidylyltransferase [Planctomycetota bacterium]
MTNLAVIPARGGSKRIPGKNIRLFAGKPMLAWPIGAALRSDLFDRVVVSTDSEDIAAVAREYGAEVPFMRPAGLSDDHTPTAPVLLHALERMGELGAMPDRLCCIYPTAPFVTAEDLRRGAEIMEATGAPAVIAATSFDFPILRAFRTLPDGSLAFNWPEHELTRSQDLPEFLHDAGQFYWADAGEFRSQKRLLMPGSRPVMLPRKRVQDLDTPEDWEAAELIAALLGLGVEK